MRARSVAAVGLFVLSITVGLAGAVRDALAAEAVPGASCAGFPANAFQDAGGPENIGVSNLMFCSGGSTWTGIVNYRSSGYVGIGTTSPLAQFDVGGTGAMVAPRGTTAQRPSGVNGMIRYNSSTGNFEGYQAGSWLAFSSSVGGAAALSAITAATSTPTALANSTYGQTWNWALTGATADAFTFGETTAATGGSGDQSILKAATLTSSTAIPLMVTNLGNGLSMRVNDATGDTDTTPFVIDAAGNVGIGTATPAAPLHVTGEAIIGPTTGIACSSTTQGGLRWSGAAGTFEMCDGTSWKLLVATGGTGTSSSPNAGTGYFVMSNGTWDGNLGDLAGANALCLSDLQSNNWLNKTDAASRGLLNSSHIQAFLCSDPVCQTTLASTTYTFAASGSPATGGATFTADASGLGPGNTQNWSGANYFGSGYTYWTGNNGPSPSSTQWNPFASYYSGGCGGGNSWNNNSGYAGVAGNANGTSYDRWQASAVACTSTNHLICMVHPGNETTTYPGYLVMTSSNWNGNLGGLSGADSKCLTELTTYTSWLGYSSANAAGQLVSGKVHAFLCDGSTCNNMMANQSYSFAKVGSSGVGGASFTTDAGGLGPNDGAAWSAGSYLSGTYSYWMGRGSWYSNWASFPYAGSGYNAEQCGAWNQSSNSYGGHVGNSGYVDASRWDLNSIGCDQLRSLLCFVNP